MAGRRLDLTGEAMYAWQLGDRWGRTAWAGGVRSAASVAGRWRRV
ncbi:hypothetical protein [Streptomyces shenzhenensis]